MSENKLSFLKVTKYMYAHVVERERERERRKIHAWIISVDNEAVRPVLVGTDMLYMCIVGMWVRKNGDIKTDIGAP